MLIGALERLARARMSDDDRRAQEAFVRDIERHWTPGTVAERRLARRARVVHLVESLWGGRVTLAQVGVAGVFTAAGSAVLTFAAPPHTPHYVSHIPTWVAAVLTFGILALAYECARSPHRIRPARFVSLVSVPVLVGAAGSASTLKVSVAPDVVLLVAFVVIALGAVVSAMGALRRSIPQVRRGLAITGVGALGICLSDGSWVVLLARDGSLVRAIGCLLTSTGAIVMANGLLFARPDVAR